MVGDYAGMRQGVHRKSLYLLLKFARNLKTALKIKAYDGKHIRES